MRKHMKFLCWYTAIQDTLPGWDKGIFYSIWLFDLSLTTTNCYHTFEAELVILQKSETVKLRTTCFDWSFLMCMPGKGVIIMWCVWN